MNSIPFEDDTLISDGPDAGYHHMATGAEVRAYFERVLTEVLLPSGRVRYLPKCRYEGNGGARLLEHWRTDGRPASEKAGGHDLCGRHDPSASHARILIGNGVRHVPVNALSGLEETRVRSSS